MALPRTARKAMPRWKPASRPRSRRFAPASRFITACNPGAARVRSDPRRPLPPLIAPPAVAPAGQQGAAGTSAGIRVSPSFAVPPSRHSSSLRPAAPNLPQGAQPGADRAAVLSPAATVLQESGPPEPVEPASKRAMRTRRAAGPLHESQHLHRQGASEAQVTSRRLRPACRLGTDAATTALTILEKAAIHRHPLIHLKNQHAAAHPARHAASLFTDRGIFIGGEQAPFRSARGGLSGARRPVRRR